MDRIRVTSLLPILNGERTPGLYRFSSRAQPNSILADLTKRDWQGFHIDGRVAKDKASFLKTAGAAMHFPSYYGRNWDAFEECVRDLAWAPTVRGYVLLYDQVINFALRDHGHWIMARTILNDAVAEWQKKNIPMFVLLRQAWWFARDIDRLSETQG